MNSKKNKLEKWVLFGVKAFRIEFLKPFYRSEDNEGFVVDIETKKRVTCKYCSQGIKADDFYILNPSIFIDNNLACLCKYMAFDMKSDFFDILTEKELGKDYCLLKRFYEVKDELLDELLSDRKNMTAKSKWVMLFMNFDAVLSDIKYRKFAGLKGKEIDCLMEFTMLLADRVLHHNNLDLNDMTIFFRDVVLQFLHTKNYIGLLKLEGYEDIDVVKEQEKQKCDIMFEDIKIKILNVMRI